MKYDKEVFDDVIVEIIPLLHLHWEEIALNKERVPFDPNYVQYKALEQQGILDIFTARSDEGELVGYCITFTTPHLHYWSTVMSHVDIFFITPEYRGKMAGARLITFVENRLKEKGVKILNHHVKVEHDFSPILKRLKYNQIESIYSKYIGD